MDYKITNYDVLSEKNCLEQVTEIPIETDLFVADFLGDIKRVLKCKIIPYITSKQVLANTLNVDGIAVIKVIYVDKDGQISSVDEEVPFKKTFESANIIDECSCDVSVTSSCHSCRAVTERKLSIKGSVRIEAQVNVIQKDEIICDIDSENFELLRGEIPATVPLGKASKSLIIEEEIFLPENNPSISQIIREDFNTTITDCKVITNKVIVKGNLGVTILYCSTEDTIKKHYLDIPFNQILDMSGIEETCDCEAFAEVCNFNLSAKTSGDGTCRSFVVTAKLNVTAKAQCNNNITVILDAYSNKYSTSLTKKDMAITKVVRNLNETFLCKKNIALPKECNNKILDLWCSKNSCSARFEENNIKILGSIVVCAILMNENSEIMYFERIIDFEYPIETEKDCLNPFCKPEINIKNCNYTAISDSDIELKIELNIKATIFSKSTVSLISKIDVEEDSEIILDKSSLVVYYADKGENVWEICKNFLANRKELLEINHLSSEIIETPKMLLIPKI